MFVELLENASPKKLLSGAIFTLILWSLTNRLIIWTKIHRLGGPAKKIPTRFPYDLDMIVSAIKATREHLNLPHWQEWFSSAGRYTVEASPGGRRVIFTADPENIKAVLATQFGDYGKGKPFHEEWKDFLGDSIFTTDGDEWHDSRQLIRPLFVRDRVGDLRIFEEHVQVLMGKIEEEGRLGKSKGEVAIDDLFFRYTLDAATHFLLGRSVHSLEVPEQDFANAFGEVQRIQNLIARAGPMNRFIPRKAFRAGIRTINAFVSPFITEALALTPTELASKTKSEEGYTFLHALASFTRNPIVLRDQLVAVLLAGRDTTAATLSWLFFELARHPEVTAKLREEILATVGKDGTPTYADLKGMKYLQNTVQETLRLYPVVPFNVRLALKDTTLPRGGGPDGLSPVGILKDTPIGYSTLVMQRRPDLTPDVMTFSPERWETWQPKPWNYIPFNGGPRICIGQQFALAEVGYTVVRLLQRWERVESVRAAEGERENPVLKAEIVLQPGAPVRVRLS